MIALIIIIFCILVAVIFFMSVPGQRIAANLKFIITGKDSGFSFSEILLLRKVASKAGLSDPTVLFWSLESFDKSLSAILADFEQRGVSSVKENQDFLAKLYKYRTQIEFDTPKYKKGISSTRELDVGQMVSILVKSVGVYRARVVQNTSSGLFISYPVASTAKTASPNWLGKHINVYFLRKNDASYDFESEPINEVFVHGKPSLCLSHSFSLFRTQKRKSIRTECNEPAVLYILHEGEDPATVDCNSSGSKCCLNDISEDGAAVLAGGKGSVGLVIRIDFLLGGKPVTIVGEVKAVDYNAKNNVSLLHIECKELNPDIKNIILSYVYKIMPESDKEVFDALRILEENENVATRVNDQEFLEKFNDSVELEENGDDAIEISVADPVEKQNGDNNE